MELEEELSSAKKEKQDLQKQQNTLHIIEKNFDAMIRKAGIKVPVQMAGLRRKRLLLFVLPFTFSCTLILIYLDQKSFSS